MGQAGWASLDQAVGDHVVGLREQPGPGVAGPRRQADRAWGDRATTSRVSIGECRGLEFLEVRPLQAFQRFPN
ncbi:MAG: hypothetical protein ACKOJF_23005, partial [Planctomycetaceae bacterium]